MAKAGVQPSDRLECEALFGILGAEPALAGVEINAGFPRALLLGRARAEPVVFLRRPAFDEQRASAEVRELRAELASDEHPAYAFERVLAKLKHRPALAREVFLSEGYLFTESAELGALFVNYLALELLFHEPELRIARGKESWTVKRHEANYEYAEGPELGQRARLLLFDRVFVAGSDPGPALHLDVRTVAEQAASDELRLDRLTEHGALGALRFGSDWLPVALRRTGTELSLGCERQPSPAVIQARAWARRRAQVTAQLARVVKDEVDEGLPFDEPKTEQGQQDGQLRPAWREAYFQGRDRYSFNDDTYWVFDARGRPHVPQVCIDFVTDTLERASGARFAARGQTREYVRGSLNFDDFALDNRRSVESFVSFSERRPEWFEFSLTSQSARVPFRDRARFFLDLYQHRDEYRPFDIVVIFGQRSDGKLHYHSFFVADRDPVSGMPIAVVANAGRPRIRSWENELQNAPERAILAHIRPKLPWLEQVIGTEPRGHAELPVRPVASPGSTG